MKLLLFIACGGALGAVSRYSVSLGLYQLLGRGFPYGTATVNVLGSFLIGFLSVFLLSRLPLSGEWRALISIGFLGSFTTFSSFSLETLALFERGQSLLAVLNIGINLSLCLLAVALGAVLAKQF